VLSQNVDFYQLTNYKGLVFKCDSSVILVVVREVQEKVLDLLYRVGAGCV